MNRAYVIEEQLGQSGRSAGKDSKGGEKISRASGQEEEKKKLQCVSVSSLYPSPEQIFVN